MASMLNIPKTYERSPDLAVDYIEAARVMWQRARTTCARRLHRARHTMQRRKEAARLMGFQEGIVEGRRIALDHFRRKLDELASHYPEIEEAIESRTLGFVREALASFVKGSDCLTISIPDYVESCLSVIPKSTSIVIRTGPSFCHGLSTAGIPAVADQSVPPGYIEVDLPVGTLRFSWHGDAFSAIEDRVRDSSSAPGLLPVEAE